LNRRNFLKFAIYGSIVLAGSYPVLIERNIVLVNRYKIPIPKLPAAFHGFTIAQLTDVHLGFLVSESFVTNIVNTTNQLQTDIIVCTGDYVHARNTKEEIDKVWPILTQLHAKAGVYSVLGNHDHWADTNRSLYWLDRSGQNIRHIHKTIYRGTDKIVIGGAGDYWEDELKIDSAFSNSNDVESSSVCRILLAHNPDSIDTKFHTSISLVISGHTHGGQVVIPFLGPPVLPVHNKKYTSGLIKTPKTQLFISRGIGWAIYPVRFNCYPEIAVLELVNPALLSAPKNLSKTI